MLEVKNPPTNAEVLRDIGSIPGSGRVPGKGNGNALQYSCLRIPQTEEICRLQSMGLRRVGHYWSDSAWTEGKNCPYIWLRAFHIAQMVKNLPIMWETWVWSLGQEDSLEKGMATHSNILTWRIPWTEQSMGWQRVGQDWATNTFTFLKWVLWPHMELTLKVAGGVSPP